MLMLFPISFGSISTCPIVERSSFKRRIKMVAQFLVAHFAAAKLELKLHFVSFVQELLRVPHLNSISRADQY